jgi:hypothetical protein
MNNYFLNAFRKIMNSEYYDEKEKTRMANIILDICENMSDKDFFDYKSAKDFLSLIKDHSEEVKK